MPGMPQPPGSQGMLGMPQPPGSQGALQLGMPQPPGSQSQMGGFMMQQQQGMPFGAAASQPQGSAHPPLPTHPPAAAPEAALPEGWRETKDPNTGKVYFWNKNTAEVSWDRPEEDPPAPPPPPPDASADAAPAQWKEVKDPQTGDIYYWNEVTNETTWDKPASQGGAPIPEEPPPLPELPMAATRDPEALPEGWQHWFRVVDPGSGGLYFWHEKSNTTTWNPPIDAKVLPIVRGKRWVSSDGVAVKLDSGQADLDFEIEGDGYIGTTRHTGGFAHMYSGCRATHGVKGGRYWFEARIEEELPVTGGTLGNTHEAWFGWSTAEVSENQLGDAQESFAYGSSGQVCCGGGFREYGSPLLKGDVLGCVLDLEGMSRSVSFSHNGVSLGPAFELPSSIFGKALFPHVLLRNVKVRINFGDEEWSQAPDGAAYIRDARLAHVRLGPQAPFSATQCEVVMMVGLPGSGKTVWAQQAVQSQPQKRYRILGVEQVLHAMRLMPMGAKRAEQGQAKFEALFNQATECFNELLIHAPSRLGNYIIDFPNTYEVARTRRVKAFKDYKVKAVVLILDGEELNRRLSALFRERAQTIPLESISEMQANFAMPSNSEGGVEFAEVLFPELGGPKAEKAVTIQKEAAQKARALRQSVAALPDPKRARMELAGGQPMIQQVDAAFAQQFKAGLGKATTLGSASPQAGQAVAQAAAQAGAAASPASIMANMQAQVQQRQMAQLQMVRMQAQAQAQAGMMGGVANPQQLKMLQMQMAHRQQMAQMLQQARMGMGMGMRK